MVTTNIVELNPKWLERLRFILLFGLVAACSRPAEPQAPIRRETEQSTLNTQLAVPAAELPERLRAFLNTNRDYRLMVFEDLGEFWKVSYSPGEWKQFSLADTDGDGSEDVAAVVIKQVGETNYNVIVLHGGQDVSGEPVWLIRDSKERVLEALARPNEVWPIFCRECDANRPMRWVKVDRAYERGTYFPGETACLFRKNIHAQPDERSPIVASIGEEREAEVLEMGKRPGDRERWYRVRNRTNRAPFEGWVLRYNDEEPGICEIEPQ